MSHAVACVIVTYFPGPDFEANLMALAPAVQRIILIDNSGTAGQRARLEGLAARLPQVQCRFNAENKGLAAAQNQGIAEAIAANWILLLDDDSRLSPQALAEMLAAYERHPNKERVGLVCPLVRDLNVGRDMVRFAVAKNRDFPRRTVSIEGRDYDDCLFAIASGSLIPARLLRRIGPMREAYFIDYIDVDFSFRLRARGYLILQAAGAILHHKLGERRIRRLLGYSFAPSNHPPSRRFYSWRNRSDMWKRYATRFPGYCLYDLLIGCYELFLITAFEQQKFAKLRAMLKGLCCGITGWFKNPFL